MAKLKSVGKEKSGLVMSPLARLSFVICLAAVLFARRAPAQSSSENDEARTVAGKIQANQYPEAVAEADKILSEHPKDCAILTLRGLALAREGKKTEGRQGVESALRVCPRSLLALEAAAQMDYESHAPTAAAVLERILEQKPDDQTTHTMLGAVDFRKKDCAGAIHHFEMSLPLVGQSDEAQREYGACLFLEGQPAKSEEILERVAANKPDETNTLTLAYVQWKSKHAGAALAALRPLLTLPETNSRVFTLAAQIAEDSGDTPHAVEWLRTAILKDPANSENYMLFAAISFNHASYQVGIDMVNAGLEQIPDSARLLLARGVLEVQLSHYDAALSDFQKAHALDPQLSFVQDALGIMRSQQHDASGSLALFRKQAALHPQDALLQYLYAEALSQAYPDNSGENLTGAIAAARKSLQIEPDYQPARDLLCTLLLQTKNYAEVVRQAEIALKNDPSDQSALYEQIQAERRLGNSTEVAAMVQRLGDLKKQERTRQAQYLLEDSNSSHNPK
jgi:tetratricopeptide (TPR) repeat protein